MEKTALIQNDAVVTGILFALLALIFWSEKQKAFSGFYKVVPSLLLCYFLPALLNWPLGWVDPEKTKTYFVASRYLLPASLILLTLSVDIKATLNLGPKTLLVFLAGTLGVVIGGPIGLWVLLMFFPGWVPADPSEVWKGLSCIAGSWIGGGPNQTAMKEIFQVNDTLFGTMVVVDVFVANVWMGFLLYGANRSATFDRWLKGDNTAVEVLKKKMEDFQSSVERTPKTYDLIQLLGITFGGVALSHFLSDYITGHLDKEALKPMRLEFLADPFIWMITFATIYGLVLSVTKARSLEGIGASKWGSVFIYFLVASIGIKMNLGEIGQNLGIFIVGIVWMLFHGFFILLAARILKAPFFFAAVGSQANIGGAASAPIVATAFSPALAPVGVLLAMLGYVLGTYGALLSAYLMEWVAVN